MREDIQYRADFVRELGELFVKHGEKHYETYGIKRMELTEDGNHVRVFWNEDDYTEVDVTCDSLVAIVYDVWKKIY